MLLEDDVLARSIGDALVALRAKVAVAETTAGGLISARLLSVAGASAWFERGVVCYSREAKIEATGADAGVLAAHGAVSRESVVAMAEGLLARTGAQYAIAESGIAGPPGGHRSPKPVGTSMIAIATAAGTTFEEHLFAGSRIEVMEAVAQRTIELLWEHVAAAAGIGAAEPSAD